MHWCKTAEKKEIEKDSSKIEVPVIFVKGNYFGTPLYTMCWINEGNDKRVKGGFHVITCNLTASASHLLVSAVPRI
jgi:hypothetical protein